MSRKLAVITGTFNPVTIAHMALGKTAKKILGKDCQVVYVPAKSGFLRSWKHMEENDIFSDADRYDFLKKAANEEGFHCDSCEIDHTVPGNTYLTLGYLAEKFQIRKQDVYYICGSDKLPELNKWSYANKFIEEYRFLVVKRNFDNVEEMIQNDSFLSKQKNHFMIMDSPMETQTISATMVRKALKEKRLEEVRKMIPDSVYRELERKIYYEC